MIWSGWKRASQKKFPGIGVGSLITFLLLIFYILSRPDLQVIPPWFMDLAELKTLDYRFKIRGKLTPSSDVAIVVIDEKTIDKLDSWQSTRRKWLAELIDKLAEGGAKVIGFDVNFAERDRNPGLDVIQHLRKQSGKNTGLGTVLDELESQIDFDVLLAKSFRNAGNVVLGIFFFRSRDEGISHITPEQSQRNLDLISSKEYKFVRFPSDVPSQPLQILHMVEVEPNFPELSQAVQSFGHFNMFPDRDGVFRRVPLLLEYKGAYYPSLDIEIIRLYLGSPQPIIYGDKYGIVSKLQLGKIMIPCDEQGRLLVNYYGPAKTFPHYSLSDVVDGATPSSTFKDKIVLVGSTAIALHDLRTTPFQTSEDYPGVEIHANVIENILHHTALERPNGAALIDGLIILVTGLLSTLIFSRLKSVSGMIAFVILLLLLIGGICYAFTSKNLWLNVTFPGILILLSFISVTGQKYFQEEREKKKIKGAFEHYLAPRVVNELLKHPEKLNLGGERKVLTVLFSDIRGFTSTSESMESQRLVELLNEYLTAMTDVVFKHQGTLNKYMGDAIMAFYGAPIEQNDHALKACLTAIDMIEELKKLHEQWVVRKLPKLNIGIGINSGEMIVGNMGSKVHFDYTVLGDAVNLASRLEGINKRYGTNIIISENTYQQVKDQVVARELDLVRVKGKYHAVIIYEVLGRVDILPKVQEPVELFQKGLTSYRNQKWYDALAFFQKVLYIYPNDAPSMLYVNRCVDYIRNPPPPDWNGIYELEAK
jgi:adenylate cyclase